MIGLEDKMGQKTDIDEDEEALKAAFDYVEGVLDTADDKLNMLWHGWALQEAFLAGIKWAEERDTDIDYAIPPKSTTEYICTLVKKE